VEQPKGGSTKKAREPAQMAAIQGIFAINMIMTLAMNQLAAIIKIHMDSVSM
jgi:hypothetical protein